MKHLNKTALLLAVSLTALLVAGCSGANLEETKANAEKVFNDNGFSIVGYHGYEWGKHLAPTYGGAYVWYTVKKESNGIVYEAALQRWGDEYHLYALSAIDAIKPGGN